MLQKKDIETILKINGVAPTSPEEEIRSILLSARYNDSEIDMALMVLRENTQTLQTKVDGLHKIFRSDQNLKPAEISSLLGIDVQIDEVITKECRNRELTMTQSLLMILLTIILAVAGVFAAMFFYKVGIFHPTISAFGY